MHKTTYLQFKTQADQIINFIFKTDRLLIIMCFELLRAEEQAPEQY